MGAGVVLRDDRFCFLRQGDWSYWGLRNGIRKRVGRRLSLNVRGCAYFQILA